MKIASAYRLVCVALAFMLTLTAFAEELNCKVEINTQKVANVNKDVFTTLQEAITDYMNTTQWTDAQFYANEKIECQMFFTISEVDGNKYTGDLQIQSIRPVYNSTYTTNVLNFKDNKIEFTYEINQPLVFSETTMESNLTAILNYYAYLIIALDFDTFSPQGGTPYYDKCANVVRLAQSTSETGWKAFEDTKNRSAVLSAYTDKTTSAIRDILYDYHRKGLDEMVVSPDKGRAMITSCIEKLRAIFEAAPMSVCISMFKDSKLDELVNVYSKSNPTEKNKVYEMLQPIYPTENTRLDKIKDPETAKN